MMGGWLTRFVLRRHRLSAIPLVQLGSTISEIPSEYGSATRVEVDEDFDQATVHTYDVGDYHEAVLTEWQGRIHQAAYFSQYPEPGPDLNHMMEFYGEGHRWTPLEHGYLYRRNDDDRTLWCSAAPAIGLATTAFRNAKQGRAEGDEEASDEPEREPVAPNAMPVLEDGQLNPAFVHELLPIGEGAGEDRLAHLENRLGQALPRQYRELLSLANGGAPEFSCWEGNGVSIYVQYIWGITEPDEYGDTGVCKELTLTGSPSGWRKLVPIARGGQSDAVFLSLRDGSIWYREFPEAAPLAVAPTLGDFLGRLRDDFAPESEDPDSDATPQHRGPRTTWRSTAIALFIGSVILLSKAFAGGQLTLAIVGLVAAIIGAGLQYNVRAAMYAFLGLVLAGIAWLVLTLYQGGFSWARVLQLLIALYAISWFRQMREEI